LAIITKGIFDVYYISSIFLLQIGVVSDYDLLALDSMSGIYFFLGTWILLLTNNSYRTSYLFHYFSSIM